jgi:hypothetical protein
MAYTRFRETEALLAGGTPRQQAEAVLRSAHQTTIALGALPLRREIELLAQRGPASPRTTGGHHYLVRGPAIPGHRGPAIPGHLAWPDKARG